MSHRLSTFNRELQAMRQTLIETIAVVAEGLPDSMAQIRELVSALALVNAGLSRERCLTAEELGLLRKLHHQNTWNLQLTRYTNGDLPEGEIPALKEHVSGCTSCQGQFRFNVWLAISLRHLAERGENPFRN